MSSFTSVTRSPPAAAFPCGRGALRIPGPVGELEAISSCPEPRAAVAGTAVICHPHPLHGGTMHNKVVHTLARALDGLGLRTLRFNFRGVGASAGAYDEGVGETEDLLAVLEWVRTRRPADEVWLAGFSFGTYVVARAATRFPATRLITVAPAVRLFDFSALEMPRAPWLVIQGDQDEITPPEAVRRWVAHSSPEPELVMLPGVGHFFHQRLHELRTVVADRLAAHRPPPEHAA